ncbi:hypothetical protein [Streptomyces sp. TS71-3]|uniref:hypothetical protein n=1 Tax=Streptomyces sp. TS71-3 TaxID=2733862 RepID=UPI001BB3A21E|nr:hypothetical protein [Streptomyces sp. TS71-3]
MEKRLPRAGLDVTAERCAKGVRAEEIRPTAGVVQLHVLDHRAELLTVQPQLLLRHASEVLKATVVLALKPFDAARADQPGQIDIRCRSLLDLHVPQRRPGQVSSRLHSVVPVQHIVHIHGREIDGGVALLLPRLVEQCRIVV